MNGRDPLQTPYAPPAPAPLGEPLAPHPGYGSGAELWLARHGEVHADWRGTAYGNLDVPLSEAGRAHTAALARVLGDLRPDRVLASPLERARLLGESVAARAGRPLELRPELAEIHRGRWQGRSVAELHAEEPNGVRELFADPWSWRGHGGESDSMLSERLWPAIAEGLAHATGGRVVVATHYNVVRVLLAGALGLVPAASFGLRLDPGHLVLLEDAAGGWRLRHANVAGVAGMEVARP